MYDEIPPGVVKPSPIPMNAATEEDSMSAMMKEMQNSRRLPPTNLQQHPSEQQLQISPQVLLTNANELDLSRANQCTSQSLPHLPQPIPRIPNNIPNALPPHDQGNVSILQLIAQAPFNPELLKLPDAISLQTALNSGQVAPTILLNQVQTTCNLLKSFFCLK